MKACERLFNIDLDMEARNAVVARASKLKNCSFEEATDLQDDRPCFEFEDVGGACDDSIENRTHFDAIGANGWLVGPGPPARAGYIYNNKDP